MKLRLGHSISRARKSKHVLKDQERIIVEKFSSDGFTPWQYLNAFSNTIGGIFTLEAVI